MTTWHRRTIAPRTSRPARTHSGCCKARVERGRCSECRQVAPWGARLTLDEAEQVTAREALAAAPLPELSAEAKAKHRAEFMAMFEPND